MSDGSSEEEIDDDEDSYDDEEEDDYEAARKKKSKPAHGGFIIDEAGIESKFNFSYPHFLPWTWVFYNGFDLKFHTILGIETGFFGQLKLRELN